MFTSLCGESHKQAISSSLTKVLKDRLGATVTAVIFGEWAGQARWYITIPGGLRIKEHRRELDTAYWQRVLARLAAYQPFQGNTCWNIPTRWWSWRWESKCRYRFCCSSPIMYGWLPGSEVEDEKPWLSGRTVLLLSDADAYASGNSEPKTL